jgi:hypothetical protein
VHRSCFNAPNVRCAGAPIGFLDVYSADGLIALAMALAAMGALKLKT